MDLQKNSSSFINPSVARQPAAKGTSNSCEELDMAQSRQGSYGFNAVALLAAIQSNMNDACISAHLFVATVKH